MRYILIIEDYLDLVDAYFKEAEDDILPRCGLDPENYQLLHAESAEQAWEIVEDKLECIDLIIADIALKKDKRAGIRFVKEFGRRFPNQHTLIHVVSSGNNFGTAQRTIKSKKVKFTKKPLKTSDLYSIVARIINEMPASRANSIKDV